MERNAISIPQLELNPTNWISQFGDDGFVATPIGKVKMGENQITKLFERGRSDQFGMIKPTLESPQVVIEMPSEATNGESERKSSLLFVKTFIGNDGNKIYYFKSVTVKRDGLEVSISSHYDREKRIREALKKGKLLYRFDGGAQTEHRPADVSVTTSPESLQGKEVMPASEVQNKQSVADNTPKNKDKQSSDTKQVKYRKSAENNAVSDGIGVHQGGTERESRTEPQPIGQGEFGNIYDQFKGKAKEAIAFLRNLKSGEAIGALHHKDIGEIAIVWGNAKAGLQKIAKKHPEVLDNLQEAIDGMNVVQESDNRIKLESDTHFAVVSRDWQGKKRSPWLLTAYEKKESSATNNRMDTADTLKGKRNDTATP